MSDQTISTRREKLNPAQRAELERRIRGNAGAKPHRVISQVSKGDRTPLSFAQQRQWFLWRMDPGSTAYHLCGGLLFAGQLDVDVLRASLRQLVTRHVSLRTTFQENSEGLVEQVVHPSLSIDLPCVDLSKYTAEQVNQRLHAEIERVCKKPFHLDKGPLLRALLIKCSEREHRLVVAMHHIISDAQSTQIILDEMAVLYRGQLQGTAPHLPELPIQYTDYALWQRDWMASADGERQLNWWCKQLGNEQQVLALQTDYARTADGRYNAARHRTLLSPDLVRALRNRTNVAGGTLFTALLAAFSVLLFRYSGQSDQRIGVPIAGRHLGELQDIVGFFVNTQVVCARVDERLSLNQLLTQIQTAAFEAQSNSGVPFERLVEALRPERTLGANPLFQVLFNHLRMDQGSNTWPGLTVERLNFDEAGAQFELTLQTTELGDGQVEACFTYARELFAAVTIERMAGHYIKVLEALVDLPEQAVGEIELLDQQERKQLAQWGINNTVYPDIEPVHHLIEQCVQIQPEAVALVCNDKQLTFAELNSRANRLAHHLILLGVKPEVKVGIAVEHSIAMVIGLLAILKAGGAYVPLDPEYPRERLAYMIDDSGIDVLLTHSHLKRVLPARAGIRLLELNALDLSERVTDNPQVNIHGENLAYVIYTSGSTGKPKGVMVRHKALSHFLLSMQKKPGIKADDILVAATSLSFDIAALELYLPLITGAQIVLASRDHARDGGSLADLVASSGATLLQCTPASWRLLLASGWTGPGNKVLKGLCGGEALQPDLALELRRLGVDLWNLYGPTETTIWSATSQVGNDVNLGQAIAATEFRVLDAGLTPVPIGVVGELYIGGIGLARGYLCRPELASERFIADPFSNTGERLYRTGDLVCWNSKGQLEYLGRIDHQIKIRGYRIELGEVEAELLVQSEIREAVVVARDSASGMRLIAYVSAVKGKAVDGTELRERLHQVLPEYMVPSGIAVLDTLPLNANGKVDRKALPECDMTGNAEYEPPQGEVEAALAHIWGEVLGVERVGRHDNFFELGGHSLTATMLTSRVRAVMGVNIPLRKIFEHACLQRQADYVDRLRSKKSRLDTDDIPLVKITSQDTIPLSPTQLRLWLVERMGSSSSTPAYTMAAALRLSGELDLTILKHVFEMILSRHEILRTVYPEDDEGNPIMVVQKTSPVELPVTDIAHESEIDSQLAALSAQPFNLMEGPLLRVNLLRLSAEQHALLLSVHHIVFDGWSEAVFVKEFVALYQALRAGEASGLPELTIQYTDYAVWHQRRLEASAPRDAGFWSEYLNNAPARSTLPPDILRESRESDAGGSLSVAIRGELADAVNHLAIAHETSSFTVLFAGFTAWLHQHNGVDDLVIGTDVAGRDHHQLEDLMGFFVNVLPLRSQWSKGLTFLQWLEQIKETTLSAFEYRDVPFDHIVEYAGVPRTKSRNPLVQMLFVMQNTPRNHFDIPGLDVEFLPAPVTTSKFDSAVFVKEGTDGLSVEWVFSTDLYRRETIQQACAGWLRRMQKIVGNPTELLDAPDKSNREVSFVRKAGPMPPGKLDKLNKIARTETSAVLTTRQLVRTSFLAADKEFPLLVEAICDDIDAVAWASNQKEFIATSLCKHAGILFRNFGLKNPQEFEAFAEAIEPDLHGSYGDLPKKKGGCNIYRSTPYPERQMILYHNESSHLESWPRKQWFFCELPSRVGGATPIVDCREMLCRLPLALVDKLESKGLLYVRTFLPGLDVSWQDFFKTDNFADVEKRLVAFDIEWCWIDEHTLQTRTRCPAVIRHPYTGERVFFNQMQLHHVSCLESWVREDLLDVVGEQCMPRQVYYGDGSPISEKTMSMIGQTYEACAVRFKWQQGDVVMLDNMLAAHARDPYEEPRKIVVAMGDMVNRSMLNDSTQVPLLQE